MKSDFKTKLIQHMLNKKNGEEGFTLIELLVVIIIIGILAAIALPSFLNQASKARQSEAKTYVGSANRSQQAYYLEKQQFAPSLNDLAIGISPTTTNYTYTSGKANKSATPVAKGGTAVNTIGTPGVASSPLKSYVGSVSISTPSGANEATSLGTLCEQKLAPVNDSSAFADSTGATLDFVLSASAAPSCPLTTTAAGTGYAVIQ